MLLVWAVVLTTSGADARLGFRPITVDLVCNPCTPSALLRLRRQLPGQVPVKPPQRSPDHWALVPASGHDFAADRLSSIAQPLAHYCHLKVSRPAAQEMNTVDADTYLGMVAQVD